MYKRIFMVSLLILLEFYVFLEITKFTRKLHNQNSNVNIRIEIFYQQILFFKYKYRVERKIENNLDLNRIDISLFKSFLIY